MLTDGARRRCAHNARPAPWRVGVVVAVLAAMLALGGCNMFGASGAANDAGPVATRSVPQDISAYRLGPGDKLKVTVFGQPQESGQFDVDGSGNIAYPLLGQVHAKGLTAPELQEKIRTELNAHYIVNPRVTVEVQNYRPFYIYGEVNRAGSYPYVAGLTVRRAVAIAGGYTRRARFAPVTIVRETNEGVHELSETLDQPVLPGDSVEVMRRLF